MPARREHGIMRAMNLLLLDPDACHDNRWRIEGSRFQHITGLLGLGVGACLRAGVLNGMTGEARIESIGTSHLEVSFRGLSEPPAALPLTLILALPRPKMLKRILIDTTSLGIKRLVLLNSWKVDKSYWQTPQLKAALLREKMWLGLEQAMDTRMPELILAQRFKPFVEDQLDTLCGNSLRLLADPGDYPALPMDLTQPTTLAIGPEGGWTDYERDQFLQRGFASHSLGSRILRVETAVPALAGRLMHLP